MVITKGNSIATTYIMSQCLEQIDDKLLSVSHPFHQSMIQWNDVIKSNLIVTIFNKYLISSIAVVGQIEENIERYYIIDGTQRVTAFLEFKNNKLQISNNIHKSIIKYQEVVKDENGNINYEIKEFDLRGKFYKDLPENLQDEFDGYNIHVDLYPKCSNEDILFHILRYHTIK